MNLIVRIDGGLSACSIRGLVPTRDSIVKSAVRRFWGSKRLDFHESTVWAFLVEITDFWSVHHFLTMKDKSVDIFRVERLTERGARSDRELGLEVQKMTWA